MVLIKRCQRRRTAVTFKNKNKVTEEGRDLTNYNRHNTLSLKLVIEFLI